MKLSKAYARNGQVLQVFRPRIAKVTMSIGRHPCFCFISLLSFLWLSGWGWTQEYRFVWVEKASIGPSAGDVLEKIRAAGFNGVVVPALKDGLARYDSRLSPRADGEDASTVNRIGEFRSRNLLVAAYVQAFIHGGAVDDAGHLAKRFPDWLSSRWDGLSMGAQLRSLSSGQVGLDGVFFDPGIPRFAEFLLGLVSEIMETWAPEWLILDQVRFPLPEPLGPELGRWEQPYGFHPVARSRFESDWGTDPAKFAREPLQSVDSLGREKVEVLMTAWDEWRRGLVDSFVQSVRSLLEKEFPQCRLAVVGYPDPFVARKVAMQDWPRWLEEETVDAVILPDNRLEGERLRDLEILSVDLADGIWLSGPLSGELDRPRVLSQKVRNLSIANGVVLFDSTALEREGIPEALASSWRDTSPAGGETSRTTNPKNSTVGSSSAETTRSVEGIRALYGFDPKEPPFQGLTPNDVARNLKELGFDAVFGGSADASMRRALDVAGIKRFEEFQLFAGEKHWQRHPESQPVAKNGKKLKKTLWYAPVCPNQPWLRTERLERILSRVVSYELQGVWLDFVRYPVFWEEVPPFLPETCFCPECLKQFQEKTGLKLEGKNTDDIAQWILDRHAEEWYRWRADQILEFVQTVSTEVKKLAPKTVVGAFVLPWAPEEYDGALYRIAGQDLAGFAERVDVLSPMLYFHELGKSPAWVSDRIAALSREFGSPVLPILQCYDQPTPIPPGQFEEALAQSLNSPSNGVILFRQKHLEDTGRWEKVREVFQRTNSR